MAMTLIEIEAGIKLLSLLDKQKLLQALMREMGTDVADIRKQLTLEAMQDVDNGRFVEHEDVEKWAASLGTPSPLPLPGK